jgi:hypothetical protein
MVGTIPVSPFIVNPSSTIDARIVLTDYSAQSIIATVSDAATLSGIHGATVNLSGGAFSETKTTGRSTFGESTWVGNGFSNQSGFISGDAVPGSVVLSGPPYPTSTVAWMESKTFDTGGEAASYYSLNWSPLTQPGLAGPDSAKFQIATNNDGTTWNYVGPDGTSGSYYTSSGTAIPGAHSGQRYFRYKLYFSTADENTTPRIDEVNVGFSGVCVPQYQAYWSDVPSGTYTATASAPGYQDATSSVVVTSGSQEIKFSLIH